MKARVLLVEDDATLARGLCDNFKAEGYTIRHAATAEAALAELRNGTPDLCVLDIMLPGRSGLDLLREIRSRGLATPVLMLTAKADVVDRVVGLELGADDYLPKPFALRELLARVGALLRRAGASNAMSSIVVGGVRFDFRALTATGGGGGSLTTRDVQVMQVLADRRGEAVGRADILEEVAGLDSDATLRTIDNHVVALRRALGDDPRRPRFIHTVRGIGYRLTEHDGD